MSECGEIKGFSQERVTRKQNIEFQISWIKYN